MKITVQIVIDAQDGTPPATEQVAVVARDDLTMASAGLALAEAHEVLTGIQHHLAAAQAAAAAAAGRPCRSCGRARARKDTRHIVLRTLFGTLRLDSPRFKSCPCAGAGPATVSPVAALLPERTTPELLLWEARYAALTSYGAAASLLSEAFPLGRILQATVVRQQVERTAARLEEELGEERVSFIDTCPADWEEMPRPGLPLVVALDGGYVHSSRQTSRRDGWFEAVTGTSTLAAGGPAKTFAFVQTYDTKPKRRLYELLRSQGMQDNQQVVFLTDGGEDVRDLPRYLNPQAEHYLDWFHITMRLTVLRQMTRSLPPRPASQDDDDDAPWIPDPVQADRDLERVKHFLWHGNTFRAMQVLEDLRDDFEIACAAADADDKQRVLRAARRVLHLHRAQQRGDPELRRALPLRRADLHRHRRGHRQPGHQPPHGQEAADAMVTPRGSPSSAGPYPRPQQRSGRRLRPLVPRARQLRSASRRRRLNRPRRWASRETMRMIRWQARTLPP